MTDDGDALTRAEEAELARLVAEGASAAGRDNPWGDRAPDTMAEPSGAHRGVRGVVPPGDNCTTDLSASLPSVWPAPGPQTRSAAVRQKEPGNTESSAHSRCSAGVHSSWLHETVARSVR